MWTAWNLFCVATRYLVPSRLAGNDLITGEFHLPAVHQGMKGLGMSIQEVCEGERTGFCVFNSESGSLACFMFQ